MHGHENFIYSLAAVSTGELVSSSEDRTVRIWSGNQCIQTITHPAISVWSVAVCKDNGDIVTGASDKIVRVFSRSPERVAEPATLKAFEESVQTSSIPQQPLGDINKTDLPGPDFLKQKSGTKEGQVQLIKERNGNVSAYQWSSGADQWVSVGTVVDAAGNASKVSYNGKDYDYVFDVDIEEGKPALKLPYNASQNPYEVAQKFILHNELPLSYIDQVANFIIQNNQGTVLGGQNPNQASESAPGSDPWGTESRY
jgi:phospholipase A-2-activating protein